MTGSGWWKVHAGRFAVLAALSVVLLVVVAKRVIVPYRPSAFERQAEVQYSLKRLFLMQSTHRGKHRSYAASLDELKGYAPVAHGVRIRIVVASDSGFLAEGTHDEWPTGRCLIAARVYLGDSLRDGRSRCFGELWP